MAELEMAQSGGPIDKGFPHALRAKAFYPFDHRFRDPVGIVIEFPTMKGH